MTEKQPISIVPSSYTIHNLNIITSTKIHQKVNQVLRIFDILPPVTSTKTDQATATVKAPVDSIATKPARIVVELKAKANVASKLISIVEILKRDLAKREEEERSESNNSTARLSEEQQTARQSASKLKIHRYSLHQYTTVTTTRIEVKPKPARPKQKAEEASKTPKQASHVVEVEETEEPVCQGQKRKRSAGDSQDSIAAAQSPSKKTKLDKEQEKHDEEGEHKDANTIDVILKGQELAKNEVNEDEADDEGFEEMRPNSARLDKQAEKDYSAGITQERDVPMLTIYLAMMPVPELATAFGEQTNRNATDT